MLIIAGLTSCALRTAPPTAVDISIAAFNDFHGHLSPPASPTLIESRGGNSPLPTGGIAYLSTLLKSLRATQSNHVFVAAGDLIGGSPLNSALFYDEPTIEMLSQIGLEFSSVGNHEFDRGREELLRMQDGGCAAPSPRRESCQGERFSGARFSYLAANVIDEKTGRTILPPYGVKRFNSEHGTVSVAFIGLVLKETPTLVIPSGVAGLRFVDEADSANALIPELRAQGIEAVVVLIHQGGSRSATNFDEETCADFSGPILDIVERLDPEIDLIISGHTHRTYICPHAGRLVTSAGAEGRFLTAIDMRLDASTGEVITTSARQHAVVNDRAPNLLANKYPALRADPQLQAPLARNGERVRSIAERRVARLTADILRNSFVAEDSPLGKLVADAQLAATQSKERGGAQIAFMNRGGLRADLLADDGVVAFSDLFAIHPFGNALVTMSLTGAQIRQALEEQATQPNAILFVSKGFSYSWDPFAATGARVVEGSMRLDGERIDASASYRVTVNEFLAGGGDGIAVLKHGTERVRGMLDVEALEEYLANQSRVQAPTDIRVDTSMQ
ncbi:MAG TPA: bifunctional metallophosphatase/5'-nucleotidase [Steroidobacteraceae bacterium]|nr:bifunctional metallophosphatase/5'-nucleotidase [Steroidobacteraceae bacterium]